MPPTPKKTGQTLREFYDALLRTFGQQHWWPGDTRDEIIIGAVLTQNTAWANVERAIEHLKSADMLSINAVHQADLSVVAELIRPSGTYVVKAKRLKELSNWIHDTFGGDLDAMFSVDRVALRAQLLQVNGIGPETADAILLYAGSVPTFVVDAYTRRILRRHFLIDENARYEKIKELFECHTDCRLHDWGEYHALLVELGKRYCGPTAKCESCPLASWPHDAGL